MSIIMYVRALMLYLLTWTSGAYHQLQQQPPFNFTEMKPTTTPGPTLFFPVSGNVFPLGYFTVTMGIGNPPRPYVLDIDTGSDLTWVTCLRSDPTPKNPYLPRVDDVIRCRDPECIALSANVRDDHCASPSIDACKYSVSYADGSKCAGILIRGVFHLRLSTGTWIAPNLVFGCGLKIRNNRQNVGDGVLGLGKGNSGILSQLHGIGVLRDAVSHCFSGQGGGYLFVGDYPDLPGMAWKQIVSSDVQYYKLGNADILLDGQPTDIKGLEIIFDSGSTYTYLIPLAYEALLDLVTRNLNESPLRAAPDDKTLPMCWRRVSTPITSVGEVSGYFKPLALNFVGPENARFEMRPESYLIVSKQGNVCLGILDILQELGIEDKNIIGDISMLDKLVIYDNQNGRVGWAATNCNTKRN